MPFKKPTHPKQKKALKILDGEKITGVSLEESRLLQALFLRGSLKIRVSCKVRPGSSYK